MANLGVCEEKTSLFRLIFVLWGQFFPYNLEGKRKSRGIIPPAQPRVFRLHRTLPAQVPPKCSADSRSA